MRQKLRYKHSEMNGDPLTSHQKILARRCTKKEREFVKFLLLPGTTQADAYQKAGSKAKNNRELRKGASKMILRPRVKEYYDAMIEAEMEMVVEAKAADVVEHINDRNQYLRELNTIAMAPDEQTANRLKAMDMVFKAQGWNAAEKFALEDNTPPVVEIKIVPMLTERKQLEQLADDGEEDSIIDIIDDGVDDDDGGGGTDAAGG